MIIKVFILGRPGSGKSTAARFLAQLAMDKGFSILRLDDFEILQRMFLEETEHFQFQPTLYDGFEVIDSSAFDQALINLEDTILYQKYQAEERDENLLMIIEFARNNYYEAFKLFNPNLLKDAYFLFIDTDLDKCAKRIQQRMLESKSPDNHYISKSFLVERYPAENRFRITACLAKCGANELRVFIIPNKGFYRSFARKVKKMGIYIFNHSLQ